MHEPDAARFVLFPSFFNTVKWVHTATNKRWRMKSKQPFFAKVENWMGWERWMRRWEDETDKNDKNKMMRRRTGVRATVALQEVKRGVPELKSWARGAWRWRLI